ncbi:hypothetical protein GSI_10579 [Ganoderma sinense ZZ0214-1]|uniref:Uncharacterized protein n=1 Tax=Ganoderma sinense ZZ0214-1 TaxID=1077348 RepID=A0A2G8S0Z2_9APHY|nr:hypothetical protein GSI_10579 [Ganoderma sinense ZZ0214-1]
MMCQGHSNWYDIFHGHTQARRNLPNDITPLASVSHKQERVQLALSCIGIGIRVCVRIWRVTQIRAEAARVLTRRAPVGRFQGTHAELRDRPTSNPRDGTTTRSRVLSRRPVVNCGRGGGTSPEEGCKPQRLWCLERVVCSFLRRLRGQRGSCAKRRSIRLRAGPGAVWGRVGLLR